MSQNRRDFIRSSAAIVLLTVSKASAQTPRRKIGMVHSTGLTDEFKACFLKGLKDGGWDTNTNATLDPPTNANAAGQYGGTYGHQVLQPLVKAHGSVHLIVAAGGMVSGASAFDVIPVQIPFVYLAGRPTLPDGASSSANGKYCGVILNTSAQYANAVNNWSGVAPAGVWLVQNYNSEMAAAEYADWGTNINTNRFQFFAPQPSQNSPMNNDSTAYPQEVARLKNLAGAALSGVVVSSDPYFRSTASDFTSALAALNVPVCYPFKDFNPTGSNILLPAGAVLSSSDLAQITNTAYYQLGLRAADVLNHQSPGGPSVPTTSLPSVTWNGTRWV